MHCHEHNQSIFSALCLHAPSMQLSSYLSFKTSDVRLCCCSVRRCAIANACTSSDDRGPRSYRSVCRATLRVLQPKQLVNCRLPTSSSQWLIHWTGNVCWLAIRIWTVANLLHGKTTRLNANRNRIIAVTFSLPSLSHLLWVVTR